MPKKKWSYAEAMKRLNDSRITYTIAGRCKQDTKYNKKIEELSSSLSNINRIDRYIPDTEYEDMISNCDFLVLCDEKQASCASNGTMTEALLHGKPIIAPDFNPFKYEVEKYGVGMLYRYNDVDSLCVTIQKALNEGVEPYITNISSYQEIYLEDYVVNKLKEQLEKNDIIQKL